MYFLIKTLIEDFKYHSFKGDEVKTGLFLNAEYFILFIIANYAINGTVFDFYSLIALTGTITLSSILFKDFEGFSQLGVLDFTPLFINILLLIDFFNNTTVTVFSNFLLFTSVFTLLIILINFLFKKIIMPYGVYCWLYENIWKGDIRNRYILGIYEPIFKYKKNLKRYLSYNDFKDDYIIDYKNELRAFPLLIVLNVLFMSLILYILF